jgi:hypothetical protein
MTFRVAFNLGLYGSAQGRDNPGENQHIDMGGPGPQQRAGAGIDSGAGRQHIVDQHQPSAGDFGPLLGRHPESALNIVGPLGFGQADLLRRGAHALDDAM